MAFTVCDLSLKTTPGFGMTKACVCSVGLQLGTTVTGQVCHRSHPPSGQASLSVPVGTSGFMRDLVFFKLGFSTLMLIQG